MKQGLLHWKMTSFLPKLIQPKTPESSHKGAGGCRLIFPDGRELLGLLVVTGKSVDPALNQNQPKLRVLVLSVPLQMLTDGNSLLDQMVQILRNFRCQTWKRPSTIRIQKPLWKLLVSNRWFWLAFSQRKYCSNNHIPGFQETKIRDAMSNNICIRLLTKRKFKYNPNNKS